MKRATLIRVVAALAVILVVVTATAAIVSAMRPNVTSNDSAGAGLRITVLPAPSSPEQKVSNTLFLSVNVIPPEISDIETSGITQTSADIAWKTGEMRDSQVEYWSSPSQFSPLDPTMVIDHLVHLTDLTPGTSYYFKVMSRDAAGNLAVSDVHTFTTLGKPPVHAIPTMSQWGMIAMATLLAGSLVWVVRKRQISSGSPKAK